MLEKSPKGDAPGVVQAPEASRLILWAQEKIAMNLADQRAAHRNANKACQRLVSADEWKSVRIDGKGIGDQVVEIRRDDSVMP